MYGMYEGQNYDYYTETRLEESNPNYDAYYTNDNITNITNDNEVYGEDETKM